MTAQDRPSLNAAQRRALLAADHGSGEVKGLRSVLDALIGSCLAVAHGRRGAVYLTPAGRAVRADLAAAATHAARGDGSTEPGAFQPASGDGQAGLPTEPGERRREVVQAWAGLLEVRRLNGEGGTPAPWELARPEWAVALALEAAGIPASGFDGRRRVRSGYCVSAGQESAEVRVGWRGPDAFAARCEAAARLEECRTVLVAAGWDAQLYQRSGGEHFLAVMVPRVPRT
ncbi:hypothetical protein [Kitasatospora sp. MBT63]|uniref:hypothetical protein n=1 Tax=Kitasatospora sp. MBT63 TaxID=1444768 RepID=UPI001E5BFDAF|nr:hypothetical protein [Kitasatospora sp. MBT63]